MMEAMVQAIHTGDVDQLRRLLDADITAARAVMVDQKGVRRTLLHVATDWPGQFPRVAETIELLVAAGADVNARVRFADGREGETPLHWAASSDDIEALDALLNHGADIEAQGAVLTGGTPMSDAVIFAQWRAARRLLERGAKSTLTQSAALGLLDRVQSCFVCDPPACDEITKALWHACRGGQLETAMFLLQRGGDACWIGWDGLTPLDVARKSGNAELVQRLAGGPLAGGSIHQL